MIIIEKQKAELQRIEETKRHKEQQVSLAEQELKQVKAEIRTDKLKKTATNAATAIASGVGSLFGSGKLKELEHHIEQLHQEITKRDKATDELKIQIQQIQEQHSRQIRNLQRIHNQELEAKDKEISRLSTLLEKAHKWFPMFKEMLRMEKLCAVIGFTKDMIENLLTKKNPYNVVAKFIPKNTAPDRICFRDAKGYYTGLMDRQARDKWKPRFCFQCFIHITKCCQGNYEGAGNGIFYVFIQVTDDQYLSGEAIFKSKVGTF